MKRLFISQPMKDKTDEKILTERIKAAEKVKEILGGEEVEIVNIFFKGFSKPVWFLEGVKNKPLLFLGSAIQALSAADVVYFCDGWQNARGCKIEHECAVEYGIKIIE